MCYSVPGKRLHSSKRKSQWVWRVTGDDPVNHVALLGFLTISGNFQKVTAVFITGAYPVANITYI